MLRRIVLATFLVTVAAACSRREPPVEQPQPEPPRPTQTTPPPAPPSTPTADPNAAAAAAEARAREASARALAVLQERVHFDYDASDLRSDAQEILGRKVQVLRANPSVRLRIAGHADERGSVEYNLALGLRRANAIRDYLAGFGIDASRFDTTSMGEDEPLQTGENESAWAMNRRGEFTASGYSGNLIFPGN